MKPKIKFDVWPKTIYTDIDSMPNPMLLGLTIRYYNYHTAPLFMRIQCDGDYFTANSIDLGALGAGLNAYRNLDNFSSIAQPAAEATRTLHLTLIGYTDAAYTDEYARFSRDVTVIFIDSTDGSWTQDELDNFDDGTVQGWALVNGPNSAATLSSAADFFLSAPNALRAQEITGINPGIICVNYQGWLYIWKQFTTANRDNVYAIFNVRPDEFPDGSPRMYGKNLQFTRNGTVMLFIGRPTDNAYVVYIPDGKWMRVVVPLPKNTTLPVRIYWYWVQHRSVNDNMHARHRLHLDDFTIISKN